jgi:hypothetical protein
MFSVPIDSRLPKLTLGIGEQRNSLKDSGDLDHRNPASVSAPLLIRQVH